MQRSVHGVPPRDNFPLLLKKKKKKCARARGAGQQRGPRGPLYTINLHRKEPVAYKRGRLMLRGGARRGEGEQAEKWKTSDIFAVQRAGRCAIPFSPPTRASKLFLIRAHNRIRAIVAVSRAEPPLFVPAPSEKRIKSGATTRRTTRRAIRLGMQIRHQRRNVNPNNVTAKLILAVRKYRVRLRYKNCRISSAVARLPGFQYIFPPDFSSAWNSQT